MSFLCLNTFFPGIEFSKLDFFFILLPIKKRDKYMSIVKFAAIQPTGNPLDFACSLLSIYQNKGTKDKHSSANKEEKSTLPNEKRKIRKKGIMSRKQLQRRICTQINQNCYFKNQFVNIKCKFRYPIFSSSPVAVTFRSLRSFNESYVFEPTIKKNFNQTDFSSEKEIKRIKSLSESKSN